MSFIQIFAILLVHWLADFCAQRDEDAQNKWHDLNALWSHVREYGILLGTILGLIVNSILFGSFINPVATALIWTGVNIILHFITDYFTSKWTHALWKKKQTHNFFVVIGLDQLIHYTCLFGTYFLLK